MKNLYTFFLLSLCLLSIQAFSQTNPYPHPLRGSDFICNALNSDDSVTYPESMQGWSGAQLVLEPTAPTGVQANGDDPLCTTCSGDFVSAISNYGADGFAIQRTSGNGPNGRHPLALAVAINTIGVKTITLSWLAQTYVFNLFPSQTTVQVQYRIGHTGAWTNLPTQIYTADPSGAASLTVSDTLPSAVENKPEVQLRWIYYIQSNFTSGDRIGIDNISIKAATSIKSAVSNFSYSYSGNDVVFTDKSQNSPTSWHWNFGDGTTSTEANPTHTYPPGDSTYNVTLTVSNAIGTDSITKKVVYPNPNVVRADFDHSDNLLDVTFTDKSKNAETWSWDFGDGNNSTDQNPTHTYAANGAYDVKLVITNSSILVGDTAISMDSVIKTLTVTNNSAVTIANFEYNVTAYNAQFTDKSVNAISWSWDFGDGATSNEQNPSHTYSSLNTYNVKLTVTGSNNNDEITKKVVINSNGINNNRKNNTDVLLYPNPSNNAVNVKLKEGNHLLNIRMVDAMGKEVFNQSGSEASEFTFYKNNLNKGIYFLLINTDKGSSSKKVIFY